MYKSKILILLGLTSLIFSAYLYWERTNPDRLSFSNLPIEHYKLYSINKIYPVRIILLKNNIDLPVIPVALKNGQWSAFNMGVSYLETSPVPGEKGNSILYGHNYPNLLGNLTSARPGDTIEVRLNNQKIRYFSIEYTFMVAPDDTSILENTKDNRLTLYTCAGFLDSKRFAVVARLKDYQLQTPKTS